MIPLYIPKFASFEKEKPPKGPSVSNGYLRHRQISSFYIPYIIGKYFQHRIDITVDS